MKEQLLISNRDPVICHHSVHGRDLLPGLAYIDLLYQLARERGLDFAALELANVTIYHPLVTGPDRNVLLEVEMAPAGDGLWRVVIEGRDEWAGALSVNHRRYLTAELRRITEHFLPELLDRSGQPAQLPLEQTYAECRKRGLVHRGIMKPEGVVLRTPSAHWVEVALHPDAATSANEFMFHPGLIDACGVGSWHSLPREIREGENLILPFSFESFRATALIQRSCTARIQVSGVSPNADVVYLDIDFFDESDRKVAELKRFASKLVRDPALLDPDAVRATGPTSQAQNESFEGTATLTGARQPAAIAIAFVQGLVAHKLNRSEAAVDSQAGYYELGLDSILILEVTREIEARVGASLSPTLLFEYTTIAELGTWLAAKYPAIFTVAISQPVMPVQSNGHPPASSNAPQAAASKALDSGDDGAIAIIGMAGRYPGARSVEEFWRNLSEGRDCITEVPAERWDWREWDGLRSPSGKKISKWGGFIEGPDQFDADFFRIAPREAASIDPQERLFLEVCWEAIEDAGYTPENLVSPRGTGNRRDVSVFAGVMHQDYALLGAEVVGRGERLPISLNFSSIPNRVSYTFNFHGPSLAIDTACSSSLTAIHLAVESLRHGASKVAIAGGVNLSLHPLKYITYGLMDMQSSDGRCRAFGDGGDGYVSGEGVGAIVLKPLSKAIEDGDAIYAVIKGSWINHGGKASGLTVPSPLAQAEVIADSLRDAGVDPRSIGCLEAHGTGTSLGDPIELEGLVKAFRRSTPDLQFCALGSVKSNIGHAEAAAGVGGVTKVALQLHHRRLVPSLHAEIVNPKIQLATTPFFIQRKAGAWDAPMVIENGRQSAGPRRAGISSFGASGSNAHLILEEAPMVEATDARDSKTPLVVPLSARTKGQLHGVASRLLDYLAQAGTTVSLADLAFTLQTGRRSFEERVAFLASSIEELTNELDGFLIGRSSGKVFQGSVASSRDGHANGTIPVTPHAIAQAWVGGHTVNWELPSGLRANGRSPRRLHLPAYPFERTRHWIPRPAPKVVETESRSERVHFAPRWRESALEPSVNQAATANGPVFLFAAIDPSSEVLSTLRKSGLAGSIVALPPIPDAAEWVERAVLAIFRQCQALVREKSAISKRIVVCVPYDGSEFPYRSLMGLLRSLTLESHFLQTKLIFHAGLASESTSPVIEQLQAELRNWDAHGEVMYTADGTRQVLRQELVELDNATVRTPLREDGVYWITGGLGGLGQLFARQLGKSKGARIILSGRSPLNESTRSRLALLQNEGLNVTYLPCDLAASSAVGSAVEQIQKQFGALHGIIHSAGLILDNYLTNKTEVEIHQVLAAKVQAAQNLDASTRKLPLDFLAVFSSIASFGAVGQLDYAAANAFLDVFACERNRLVEKGERTGRTVSFNWPLWKEGGMSPGAYYEEHMRNQLGMLPLDTAAGVETFLSALTASVDQIGVAVGDAKKIHAFLKLASEPEVKHGITAPMAAPRALTPAEPTGDVETVLHEALVKVFGVARSAIQPDRELTDYGADSVMLTELANHLNGAYGLELQGSAFFELSTPQRVIEHLRSVTLSKPAEVLAATRPVIEERAESGNPPRADLQSSLPAAEVAPRKPIMGAVAIIGFDGHFPDAENLDQLWNNLLGKVVSTRKISSAEWRDRGVVVENETDYDAMQWAALMPGVARFDAKFWGVDAADAAVMDPQLRLLLRSVWRCVEQSGQAWKSFTRQKIGLFVASDSVDYVSVLQRSTQEAGLGSGLSSGMLANRASYLCDFRGPSESVDTACSSVYVALNRAIQALACGQCDSALVAGVKVLLDPAECAIRDRGQLLSHSGELRSFDAKAQGYVRGEGVGCVLVKSLEAAERDGDVIHAVVSGIGVSHNGRSALSPLAPDVDAQCRAMQDAYAMAGIGPESIGYIEANGASTAFSDAAEMAAYRKFFKTALGADAYRQHRVAISAVKPNVGHLEAASGMASLLKAIMALGEEQIPPTANFEKAHSSMFLNNSPFHIPTEAFDWPKTAAARRVALHAIGIGGVNAHVILEEARKQSGKAPVVAGKAAPALFVLSAKSKEALGKLCTRWCAYLETQGKVLALREVADYSRLCREAMSYRAAYVVSDLAALIARLSQGISGSVANDKVQGFCAINVDRPVVKKSNRACDLSGTRSFDALREAAQQWVNGEIANWEPVTPQTVRLTGLPAYPFDEQEFWCVERQPAPKKHAAF